MTYSLKSSTKIMMLAAILTSFVITASASANAVFVGGEVSGVWDADTVVVVNSVYVPSGETLIIEPGVEVFTTDYYSFEILDGATLIARGSESDMIKFVPFTDGDRTLGFDFINASSESILEYCHISDALTSGIHLDNSDITIRNCLIENSEAPTGVIGGGGIEILNGSDAVIENNMIVNNFSADFGGGIYIDQSSPVIRGNTISGNRAGYYGTASGGGIASVNNSNPRILDNIITGNSVYPTGLFTVNHGYGGGIYVSGGSNIEISGNMISNNYVNSEPQTTSDGGGIMVFNSNPRIANNLITGNEAEGDNGGGIYLYNSDAELINNTIAHNIAADSGGAIYLASSNPTVINSILYFNQAMYGAQIFESGSYISVTYSDIQGGWQGWGNLDVDPLFRDAANNNYHLQDSENCGDYYTSSLIDAGSPEYVDRYQECEWGLGTSLSDMGAYGGGEFSPTSVDDDFAAVPSNYILAENFPNPFNATTTISYVLPVSSDVKLEIYDATGRKVQTLVESYQSAGEYNVTWNAFESATGMYFFKLFAGNSSVTEKMLLLK